MEQRYPSRKTLIGKGMRRMRIFISSVYPMPVNVNGSKMYTDKNDCLWLRYGKTPVYEPRETELCKVYIGRGDTVVDIGANIGYYTLLFSKLVGETGRVISFEPDDDNFAILQKNVRLNGCTNVTLVKKAVSDKTEPCKLYCFGATNVGNNTIYPRGGMRSIDIETVTLDTYLQHTQIDFVKIDVDGAEGGVILGMRDHILRENVTILTEYFPKGFREFGITGKEYIGFLHDCGYEICDTRDMKETNNDILERKIVDADSTNIFCIK